MNHRRRGGKASAIAALVLAVTSLLVVKQVREGGGGGGGLYETQRTLWPAYQAAARSWDRWGPTTSISSRLNVMAKRLRHHRGDGYKLQQSGNDWSITRSLDDTLKTLRSRMVHGRVGIVWYVKSSKDQYQEKIRKLDLNPAKVKRTEGTAAVDIIVGTLVANFPHLNIGGIYECRRTISGGISQHAHANAVDVSASFSYMDHVAHAMVGFTHKHFVPVSQILWNHKNLLSGHYVYDHTNHIHFSGSPLINTSGCSRPSSSVSSRPTTSGTESEEEFNRRPPDLGATGPTGGGTT